MRIAFVTGEYPPMEGGVGAFTQRLAQALHARGAEITIISSRQARPPDLKLRSSQLNEPIDLGYAQLVARGRRWGRKDVHMVASVAERYAIEVVNLQYQAAAFNMRNPAVNSLPFRLRGLATSVVTFHDLRTPYLFPKAGRLRNWLVRLMARQADGAIATNVADFAQLQPLQPRLAQIPIGSNIVVHEAKADELTRLRAALTGDADARFVAYFGFLNPSKGADTLIDALQRLPQNVHLLFIGGQTGASDPRNNSDFQQQLERQIAAAAVGNRVHWTGYIDDPLVSAYLSLADVVALPYKDGVSLRRGTLMAALAHGCAVVTTQGDAQALQHERDALLTPPQDAAALARAIERLLADHQLRENLRQNAAKRARPFEWDIIAEQTLAFYSALRDGATR